MPDTAVRPTPSIRSARLDSPDRRTQPDRDTRRTPGPALPNAHPGLCGWWVGRQNQAGYDSEDLLETSAGEETALAWAVVEDGAWDRLGLAVGVGAPGPLGQQLVVCLAHHGRGV